MYTAKYVIIDGSAIVFSAAIQHKQMVGFAEICESAGFVSFSIGKDTDGYDTINATCYGESISLGIPSRGDIDSLIVKRQIITI